MKNGFECVYFEELATMLVRLTKPEKGDQAITSEPLGNQKESVFEKVPLLEMQNIFCHFNLDTQADLNFGHCQGDPF